MAKRGGSDVDPEIATGQLKVLNRAIRCYHMQNWLALVKAKLNKRFYSSEVGRVRDPQVKDWTFNPEIQ